MSSLRWKITPYLTSLHDLWKGKLVFSVWPRTRDRLVLSCNGRFEILVQQTIGVKLKNQNDRSLRYHTGHLREIEVLL